MPATAPAESSRRTLLRSNPAFGRFWIARIGSGLAYQMQAVAVGWQIYGLTHSTFQLGMVGLASFLPMVLLTLPAGHVADRHDRRLVAAGALAVEVAALAVLALGSARGWLTVPEIFAAVTIIGGARAFERPATQALLPALVTGETLPKAIAWSATAFQTASIVGPALGGILYVGGPVIPYALSALLALGGSLALLWIQVRPEIRPREPVTLPAIFSGVRYIRSNPVVLGSISLDLFAVLLGGATALLPAFARDILHVGSAGLGALRAAPAVGSLAMSALLARRPLVRKIGPRMFAAVFVFGVATIVFGLSHWFWVSLAALFTLGAADIVSVVIRSSLVQILTPDDLRGRVGAVNSLFIGTSNQFGEFESGVTAAMMGTVWATVVGGVGTILVALIWLRLFPEITAFDRMPDPGARQAAPEAAETETDGDRPAA